MVSLHYLLSFGSLAIAPSLDVGRVKRAAAAGYAALHPPYGFGVGIAGCVSSATGLISR
jgi:hypothetical protein